MKNKPMPTKQSAPVSQPLPVVPVARQPWVEPLYHRIQAFQAVFNRWQTCRIALRQKKNQRWSLRRHLLQGMAQAALAGSLLLHTLPLTHATRALADASPRFSQGADNPFGLTDVGDESKPAFADLDGDGDLDALLGDASGDLTYFKNTGTVINPAFATPSDNPFGLANIGSHSSPAFSDIDADGDLDVFVGAYDGNIKYFQNTGSLVSPAFAPVSNNPFGLSDAGAQSTIHFADIDKDSDLDAFIGASDGNIKYFQNTGSLVSPAFASVSNNPFGLTNVGTLSHISLTDLDADGDLDAFMGAAAGSIRYFENTGTATNPAFGTISNNPFGLTNIGANSSPAFADIDTDGDLDAFIGATNGTLKHFKNDGANAIVNFIYITKNPYFIPNAGGYYPSPTFADLDADGDMDLFVGEAYVGNVKYYQNTGTPTDPMFMNFSVDNPFGLVNTGAATFNNTTFADLDGDGDLDVFMGLKNGDIRHQQNMGDAANPAFGSVSANPFGLTNIGSYVDPAFADLDSDGDLDAFIGEASGDVHYFKNNGTPLTPAFATPIINPFGLESVAGRSNATFADLDNDGDLDVILGEEDGQTTYFQNTGTPLNPAFINKGITFLNLADVTRSSKPAFVDFESDGDFDALIGSYSGDFQFYRNMPAADVAISQAVQPDILIAGQPVTYTFHYTNAGTSPAEDVSIRDVMPSQLTNLSYQSTPPLNTQSGQFYNWPVGSMSPGQTGVITVSALVNNPVNVEAIVNTIEIITPSPEFTTTLSNDTSTLTAPILRFKATKSDFFADLNGDTQPNPGETITYTITIHNLTASHNLSVTNVTFNDTPDSNAPLSVGSVTTSQGVVLSGNSGGDTEVAVNLGSLTDGVRATIKFNAIINPDIVDTVDISNQGWVNSDKFINLPTDNPATTIAADPTLTTVVLPSADLAISQTYIRLRQGITFTLVAQNLGPADGSGAIISDTFSAGITNLSWHCQMAGGSSCIPMGTGNLLNHPLTAFPAGSVITYTISGTLDTFRTIINTATIILPAHLADPDINNNSSTITAPSVGYHLFIPLIIKGSP